MIVDILAPLVYAAIAISVVFWLVYIAIAAILFVSALFSQVENAYANSVVVPKGEIPPAAARTTAVEQ